MVLNYKKNNKRQIKLQKAIKLLDEKELYIPAIQIMWTSIRNLIFEHLEEHKIVFNSTEEAILTFILKQKSVDIKYCIYNVYISSILIEWDSNTIVSKIDYILLKKDFQKIKNTMYDG